ncbi:hypothetical protein [Streptomyces sp. NPDC001816]|uniref:hypothetical protein n=1 Tax=Streptomyces sp. NPDC001816 TaxID=3364612 RepID=UPI00369D9D93
MDPTTRTAAALAAAAVILVTVYGTAQAAGRTLAPAQHRTTVTAPGGGEHGPEEDVALDENGRPDVPDV